MKSLINRDKYFERILPFIDKPIIKVIVGQRRVGKSYLLRQISEYISKELNGSIILIDKEDDAFASITDAPTLSAFIKNSAAGLPEGKKYILIDEIQEIENFENSIRSFAGKDDFDIYITGSNSEMLSGELSSRLSGRYVEIPIYSLDFKEFCRFHQLKPDSNTLQKFLRFGGMPFLRYLELNENQAFEYLKTVTSNIIYRDIIARYKIRNVNFLDRLVAFLASNIGSKVNAKRISDYLKSQKISISVNTVLDYMSFLINSHIIIPVKRIDLKGKKIFEVAEKYYFQDIGIRNSISGFKTSDMGKLMENAVFHHLKSNNYEVITGDWSDIEIDFVASKNNEIIYIQVTYLLSSDSTVQREFGNLLAINDNFRKMVISMDAVHGNSYQGIEHHHLLEFLQMELK